MDKYKAIKMVLMIASILLAAGTLLAVFLGVKEIAYYMSGFDYSYKDDYLYHIRDAGYADLADVTFSDSHIDEKYSSEVQEYRDLGAYFAYITIAKGYEADGQQDKASYFEAIAADHESGITQYNTEKEDMIEKIDEALK